MKIFIEKSYYCDLTYTYRVLTAELNKIGEIVDNVREADFIVFPGTCCGSLEIIRSVMNNILNVLKNKKEGAITFVTGCMTNEIKNSDLRVMIDKFLNDNFDFVISEQNMLDIINIITQKTRIKNSFGACIRAKNNVDLFISRGCANKCSFCKINYLNLPIRSVAFEDIKKCVLSLPDDVDSIRIFGTNTSQYGLDLGYAHNLMDIIKLLDNKGTIDNITIYGMAFKDAIQKNFAKDLKIKKVKKISASIETGSPRLLSMMNKGYTIPDLLAFLNEINEFYPKKLSTDIIVGFPTETYKDIDLTMQLLDTIRPESVVFRKYQNSPYVPSGKYNQLSEEKINEHYDIYMRELKLRGCI